MARHARKGVWVPFEDYIEGRGQSRIVSDAERERKRNAKRKSREEIAAENRAQNERDKEIDPVYLPSGRKRRVKSVLNNK